MTHNMVAEFSFSLWKPSEAERAHALGFNVGDFKQYRVVAGSVFNEEYNETLDSGTLVLSQVCKEDRLAKIKSYAFVRVYDKSSTFYPQTGRYKFDKIYYIDSFNEKENNIKDHIFGYTIELMSETKILEKIQCPNLTITHDVKDGVISKKKIWEYIDRYMRLFVPKIKFSSSGNSWSYEYLIRWHTTESQSYLGEEPVSFSASDFEEAEVPGYYILELKTPALFLGEGYDYDSIEVKMVSSEGVEFGNLSAEFDYETHKFTIYGESQEASSGTIIITYSYSTEAVLTDFARHFNVPCADLSFNCPTLRQLLTTLMQQVGCIPVVKNRTLEYLDFQKDAVPFGNGDYTLNNTVNFIQRSLSSDSFVNTLVNVSDQVLDSGNEVICETLGFRDRNNVLLKQTENLSLETSLPIYKINKCFLHGPGKYSGYISSSNGIYNDIGSSYLEHHYPSITYCDTSLNNSTATIVFKGYKDTLTGYSAEDYTVKISNNKIYFLKQDSEGRYLISSEQTFNDFHINYYTSDYDDRIHIKTITFPVSDSNAIGFFFFGTVSDQNGENKKYFSFIRFNEADSHIKYVGLTNQWVSLNQAEVAVYELQISGNRTFDITKLIVEQNIRNSLSRDFIAMANEMPASDQTNWNVENLSKYVYGTIGYAIGSKTISGFSEVYTPGEKTPLGWIQKNYTYIENIVNFVQYDKTAMKQDLLYYYFEFLSYIDWSFSETGSIGATGYSNKYSQSLFVDYFFNYYSPLANDSQGGFRGKPYFTTFFVDLYYQPLNSFNISYVKSQEEIDYPLEQYDSNVSGLTDFDRLSIHDQEQVDRIGNETLFISQRTLDSNDIQNFDNGPLVFKDDVNRDGEWEDGESVDYIIFKRSFTIGNNCINASYVGSKDAVLKDYFTSIRTKYRAYQYVDYNASVLRKEKNVMYVRIASDFYDGDDKVLFGQNGYLSNLVYDIENDINQEGYKRNISYEVESALAKIDGQDEEIVQTVKNSVSLITNNNTLALIYEYMDNIGAGPYITDILEGPNLGGIPQSYQIWGESYGNAHSVKFTNYIDFYSSSVSADETAQTLDNIKTNVSNIEKSPIVVNFPYTTIFSIVDNNKINASVRTFYKDSAERINHTVQFVYYAPNKDVLVGEDFISGSPTVNKYINGFNAIVSGDLEDFKLNKTSYQYEEDGHRKIVDLKEWHEPGETLENTQFGFGFIDFDKNEAYSGTPYFSVYWPRDSVTNEIIPVVKLCHYDEETNELIDIAVFRCLNPDTLVGNFTNFFFMINDTKSDYVLSEKNGILYRRYKVFTHTAENDTQLDRNVIDLYAEPEEED